MRLLYLLSLITCKRLISCTILHHLILKGLENIIENSVLMVMHMMNSITQ